MERSRLYKVLQTGQAFHEEVEPTEARGRVNYMGMTATERWKYAKESDEKSGNTKRRPIKYLNSSESPSPPSLNRRNSSSPSMPPSQEPQEPEPEPEPQEPQEPMLNFDDYPEYDGYADDYTDDPADDPADDKPVFRGEEPLEREMREKDEEEWKKWEMQQAMRGLGLDYTSTVWDDALLAQVQATEGATDRGIAKSKHAAKWMSIRNQLSKEAKAYAERGGRSPPEVIAPVLDYVRNGKNSKAAAEFVNAWRSASEDDPSGTKWAAYQTAVVNAGAFRPLVAFLKSKPPEDSQTPAWALHEAQSLRAANALYGLIKDNDRNKQLLHKLGAVPYKTTVHLLDPEYAVRPSLVLNQRQLHPTRIGCPPYDHDMLVEWLNHGTEMQQVGALRSIINTLRPPSTYTTREFGNDGHSSFEWEAMPDNFETIDKNSQWFADHGLLAPIVTLSKNSGGKVQNRAGHAMIWLAHRNRDNFKAMVDLGVDPKTLSRYYTPPGPWPLDGP